MEISKGKLKSLLRDAYISGGRYYIKPHIDLKIGKTENFDEWYSENIVKKLFIGDVTERNWFEKMPLHWRLLYYFIGGIILGLLLPYAW